MAQETELAGWQAAEEAWWIWRPLSHRYIADTPSSAATPASATRCCRQLTQAIRRHGTGRRGRSSAGRTGVVCAVIVPPPTVVRPGEGRGAPRPWALADRPARALPCPPSGPPSRAGPDRPGRPFPT